MTEQQTPHAFHDVYADLVAGLPPSQLKEARKRLTTCKQPLTDEELASEHPRVQACLSRIAAAYARKKLRSATSSKARRDAVREKLSDSSFGTTTADVTAEALALAKAEAGDGAESLVSSLSACTVECVSDAVDAEELSSTEPSRPKRCLVRPALALALAEAKATAVPAAAAAAAAVPAAAIASCYATAQSLAKKASGSSLVSRR